MLRHAGAASRTRALARSACFARRLARVEARGGSVIAPSARMLATSAARAPCARAPRCTYLLVPRLVAPQRARQVSYAAASRNASSAQLQYMQLLQSRQMQRQKQTNALRRSQLRCSVLFVFCRWGPKAPPKSLRSHIDASLSRQPVVKGERLVRLEVNAVMLSGLAVRNCSGLFGASAVFTTAAARGPAAHNAFYAKRPVALTLQD